MHVLELGHAVFLWVRLGGFTGLMKAMALSAPVKLKLGAHVSRRMLQRHIILQMLVLTHQGPHLKSWNSLVLHVLSVFDERQSQAGGFYCIKSALKNQIYEVERRFNWSAMTQIIKKLPFMSNM